MTVRVLLTLLCHYYIHWSIGDVITSSTWDTGPNAQLQIQDSPPRTPTPLPYTNPLIIDPLLKTTPPPSDPHDEFGISTVPKCEGLSTLQPGQTLIVYHPFAQHPPEVIDTAKLTLAREPNPLPPSAQPYAPFTTRTDFEQAEIFIHHNCTNTMINDQLHLNQKTSWAGEEHAQTMKNAQDLHKTLAEAGEYQDTSSVSLLYYL